MKYQGSKARHAKQILQTIGAIPDCWVEPFVGGANMIAQVTSIRRIGNDTNLFTQAMFVAAQQGWEPPSIVSEEDYYQVKELIPLAPDLTLEQQALIGFVGVGCSFAGKWFGGYARGAGRNYARESRDNLLRQIPKILDVEFRCRDYRELEIPQGALIYCDPPYAGTTDYGKTFESGPFWDWCREKARQHRIYVSEYTAPEGWRSVWEREITSSLDKNTGGKRAVERLFTFEN